MALVQIDYDAVRSRMQPGDVIAYGGYTWVSEIIKWSTRSKVSHLGVILQTRALSEKSETRFFNLVVESTKWNGFVGVGQGRLSDRLNSYHGEVWWLPLKPEVRQSFDEGAFFDFIYGAQYREFDLPQAVQAAIDFAGRHGSDVHDSFHNQQDLSKFYCSELVAAALHSAGVVPPVNTSEVTPIDLCQWSLFQDDYYQLKKYKDDDQPSEIPRYSSLDRALGGG
jgi:hypothetical protein